MFGGLFGSNLSEYFLSRQLKQSTLLFGQRRKVLHYLQVTPLQLTDEASNILSKEFTFNCPDDT